jgi:hypothetical protein
MMPTPDLGIAGVDILFRSRAKVKLEIVLRASTFLLTCFHERVA